MIKKIAIKQLGQVSSTKNERLITFCFDDDSEKQDLLKEINRMNAFGSFPGDDITSIIITEGKLYKSNLENFLYNFENVNMQTPVLYEIKEQLNTLTR